jgi:membrane protein implicated in regulation of membrane protease activity
MDANTGFDAHHTDSDAGFTLLSLHGLSSFFMMFGLVGLALYRQSQTGKALSIAGAALAGVLSVWAIRKLFAAVTRLQSNGTLGIADAVGCTGTVYLTIPKGGAGRVMINVKSRLREYDAVEQKGDEIPTGVAVRVVRSDANLLIVEKMQ